MTEMKHTKIADALTSLRDGLKQAAQPEPHELLMQHLQNKLLSIRALFPSGTPLKISLLVRMEGADDTGVLLSNDTEEGIIEAVRLRFKEAPAGQSQEG